MVVARRMYLPSIAISGPPISDGTRRAMTSDSIVTEMLLKRCAQSLFSRYIAIENSMNGKVCREAQEIHRLIECG